MELLGQTRVWWSLVVSRCCGGGQLVWKAQLRERLVNREVELLTLFAGETKVELSLSEVEHAIHEFYDSGMTMTMEQVVN